MSAKVSCVSLWVASRRTALSHVGCAAGGGTARALPPPCGRGPTAFARSEATSETRRFLQISLWVASDGRLTPRGCAACSGGGARRGGPTEEPPSSRAPWSAAGLSGGGRGQRGRCGVLSRAVAAWAEAIRKHRPWYASADLGPFHGSCRGRRPRRWRRGPPSGRGRPCRGWGRMAPCLSHASTGLGCSRNNSSVGWTGRERVLRLAPCRPMRTRGRQGCISG